MRRPKQRVRTVGVLKLREEVRLERKVRVRRLRGACSRTRYQHEAPGNTEARTQSSEQQAILCALDHKILSNLGNAHM